MRRYDDELPDEEVADLLARGILRTTSTDDDRRPGTGAHALGVLLGASAVGLLVYAMTNLPKERP